ncbi:glycoside hydrolase family 17 protein [Babjeviella inositovora NRRL Y-12698]|uniref:glucan 1,3-beta-glucosidase n=1 Tax=Babjeviella inositovora NRRL Y-12698 TaxID=984486 RepID=A0A1E3QT37_9ASCO|nr:glycoside hydrolase family 17 protein [Babjeviella inositovora NRRL Y-12698]ODQ80875.1 glycoside hydrolase family 17 protein [Babjeviella inositovora NRRL Y-12698]
MGQLGINLGVQDNQGNCKTAEEYTADLEALKPYTNIIKTYAVSDCNTLQILGPVAEAEGFQIILGVWPTDDAHFTAEQNALKAYLPSISASTIKAISVGSEALYRGDLTATQLASAISTVKNLLPSVNDKSGSSYSSMPVGFVDSWNVLVDGSSAPAIQAADFIYSNAFSYWQGQTNANSSYSFFDDIMQALQTIQTAKGSTDIDFFVGETGWPTDGTNFESSVPSVTNAANFWQDAICAMRAWGVNVAVFEAFDETWKPEESGTGDVEKHWGIFDSNRALKYSLDCKF